MSSSVVVTGGARGIGRGIAERLVARGFHVVLTDIDGAAAADTATEIGAKIKAGGGKAELTTVEGEKLTAWMDGSDLILTDANGGKSKVTIANVMQSNGVIHVVDHVLLGK